MNSKNNNQPEPAADPLDLALAAIDDYDHSQEPLRPDETALYRRAMLRTAFGQAAELRSIRNLLVMVAQTMSDALEGDNA